MELNFEGLTLDEGGMTLNLAADADAIKILDHCLIGRILTDKNIRFQFLKEHISHLWQPVKGVTIIPLEQGKFLFQLFHKLDVENILNGGPWLYDSSMIVLQKIPSGTVPKEVALDKMDIWIQVHNLPFGFIQEKVGKTIRGYVGEFKEYDAKNNLHSKFMRLKVRIDVNLPLKKEWKVRAEGGEWVTIKFKYERLGIFCFMCGILGHTDKKCTKLYELEDDDGFRGWGNDLKPEIRRGGGTATNRWLREPQAVQQNNINANNGGSGNRGRNDNGMTGKEAINDEVNMVKINNGAIINMGRQPNHGALIIKGNNSMVVPSPSARDVGLLNGPPQIAYAEYQLEGPNDIGDDGGELKKRKRRLQSNINTTSVLPDYAIEAPRVLHAVNSEDTVMFDEANTNVRGRDDVPNVKNNPLYDDSFLSAGPGNQACRGK
jgi:hypothetical protein